MTYAERKNRYDPKHPPTELAPKISQRRIDLWGALNQYIQEQGALVVSVPYLSPVRIEIAKESTLPVKLRELGYEPSHAGSVTRVTASGFVPADIIAIDLPK